MRKIALKKVSVARMRNVQEELSSDVHKASEKAKFNATKDLQQGTKPPTKPKSKRGSGRAKS